MENLDWLMQGFSIALTFENILVAILGSILGIILGAILYFLSFSIVFMKIATQVIEWIKYVLSIIINILKVPINWTIQTLAIPIGLVSDASEKAQDKTDYEIRKIKRDVTVSGADFKTSVYGARNKKDLNNQTENTGEK
ncbi:MAG: hypothetical protein ATN32_08915 [Candidatus Epulonipiscium fishelsonii]|nr:MAG: hypothetical protein ATN32_08915 [Epulopiscium sp. AS2M-Bin002]